MITPEYIAELSASSLVRGAWSEPSMLKRIRGGVGPYVKGHAWPRPMIRRLMAACQDPPNDTYEFLVRFILNDPDFQAEVGVVEYPAREFDTASVSPVLMEPVGIAARWEIPALTSSRALADWLALSIPHLDWLADSKGLERWAHQEKLRNYRYRWIEKRTGGRRLVESPKARLKSVQRQILDGILANVPVHRAAHAFRHDRSVLTFANPHVGQEVVLRVDLRDFFPSIAASRVNGIFRMAGYPTTVSQLLTGLCTNRTWCGASREDVYAIAHLPQGGPTSPTLSNLCAWHLDCRLSGLAKKFGAKYTRYADDLVFSGDRAFAKRLSRFRVLVYAIALAEGFSIRNRKTRVMKKSQRQSVAGVVVNERAGVSRRECDVLKATLTNCIHRGPASQNRDDHPQFKQHLQGRIAWVSSLNKKQGAKLSVLFDQITWN